METKKLILVWGIISVMIIAGCLGGKGVEGKYVDEDGDYIILEKGGRCKTTTGRGDSMLIEGTWKVEGDELITRFEDTMYGTVEIRAKIKGDSIILKQKTWSGAEKTVVYRKE